MGDDNVVELYPGAMPRPAIERWGDMAMRFPSIRAAVLSPHWPGADLTPGTLDAFLGTVHAFGGLRWAASFMLELWRPGETWHHAPRWSPVQALNAWDSDHKAVWLSWCHDPEQY